MKANDEICEAGLGQVMELVGAGPHTPPNPKTLFGYITVQAGAIKAKAYNEADASKFHRSSDGTWDGDEYAYLPGTVLPGRYTTIQGDSNLHAFATIIPE